MIGLAHLVGGGVAQLEPGQQCLGELGGVNDLKFLSFKCKSLNKMLHLLSIFASNTYRSCSANRLKIVMKITFG